MIDRQVNGGEGVKRHIQILMAAAAVDDRRRRDHRRARAAGDRHRLARRTTGRDDVFNDQHSLPCVQGKASPQRQRAVLALRENGPDAQRAGDLVADDDAAEGRGEDSRRLQLADACRNFHPAGLGFAGMLENERALQIAGAVQPGREPEMPFEQRSDPAEKVKNCFSAGGRHAAEYTFWNRANIRRRLIVLQSVAFSIWSSVLMRTPVIRLVAVTLFVGLASTPSVSAQAQPPAPGVLLPSAQQTAAAGTQVRRLTADEAVRLAAENNLGIQIARFDPQIQNLSIIQAQAAWNPTLNSSMQQNSNTQPPNSFLSGAQGSLNTDQFSMTTEVQQALRWGGGNYAVGFDTARSTSNNFFTNFNPQLRSSLSLNFTQPILRGFKIDSTRQQVELGQKNREIADLGLRETLTATSRTVRSAYWDLAYQIASLRVAQQSLELAEESLRNIRARVEIGTTPPIDVVEADAEVWQRREAVIVAQAQIETAEDTLRALVYNPSVPDFWTIRIEPADPPAFAAVTVDLDGAIRSALDRRTDLQQAKKTMEATDVNIRFLQNQSLPDLSARVDYGLSALGGVQFVRAPGIGLAPGEVIGEQRRGFGSVIGDLLTNDFPAWTVSLNLSYPIGRSPQQADLARTRLERTRTETELRNQELQVVTQVRQAARQVNTNQQRVQTTRSARELNERRLEAEQRKLAAGTSTNFLVFQAQRDLAVARNNELRAILDYNLSLIDFETVQEVPLR